MAKAAALQSIDSLSGIDARMEALTRLEQLTDELAAAKARNRSNMLLKRGIRAWRKGDIVKAGQWALKATEVDDSNAKALHVLAMALERMGHLHKALVTYERSFELDPSDPELLINLGLTAWNLKMNEGAAKMFKLYIQAKPDSPLGYNNLGSVLCDLGQPDMGIETLRTAIMRMPHESILWNSLATVLAEEGRADESLVFYNEAARLEPGFARVYHNLGYAYQHLGQLEDALAHYDRALELVVDVSERRETSHSRSICLIGAGKLEEGFREYEIRNDERFRAYLHHMIKAPRWKGEDIAGKRVLLVGEQGLGDEFMFANILPDVAKAVGENGKLQIAVDPRMVSLFQRSFPQAEVGAYDDKTLIDPDGNKALRFIPLIKDKEPDYWAPMGSALPFYRKTLADFPHKPFLKPDPARVAEYRAMLDKMPGKKVGLCWRSMMLGAKRAKYYSPVDAWGPVLKTQGVTFVNLQYGDCADELKQMREKFGLTVEVIPGLDLRDDIDGAAALSAALDLVISAPTAAAATAASVGAEVWILVAGRTWPQLGTDEFPWYANTRVIQPEKFADWTEVMAVTAKRLAGWVK